MQRIANMPFAFNFNKKFGFNLFSRRHLSASVNLHLLGGAARPKPNYSQTVSALLHGLIFGFVLFAGHAYIYFILWILV